MDLVWTWYGLGENENFKYLLKQNKLRKLGFANDTSEKAPICRKIYKGIIVDFITGRFPSGYRDIIRSGFINPERFDVDMLRGKEIF